MSYNLHYHGEQECHIPSCSMTPQSDFPTVKGKPRGGHPRFYELVKEITDLHDRKNTDYASGTKEGPLGNFDRVSVIMKLYPGFDWDSPFGVAMVYMLKQLDAAFTLRSQKRESVTGEPVASRLRDVSVYSLIGQIQLEEEQEHGQNK